MKRLCVLAVLIMLGVVTYAFSYDRNLNDYTVATMEVADAQYSTTFSSPAYVVRVTNDGPGNVYVDWTGDTVTTATGFLIQADTSIEEPITTNKVSVTCDASVTSIVSIMGLHGE